ncbi:MAG: hypothetical protein ACRYF0_15340 [Janthinobacterium lividum]
MEATTFLYRPVNQAELDLIAVTGYRAFPPRLAEQPIFYPVLNEDYAVQISRDWNVPYYGVRYVVRFAVDTRYLAQFTVQNVGDAQHNELWVSAEQLAEFNEHIIGPIEVTHTFKRQD